MRTLRKLNYQNILLVLLAIGFVALSYQVFKTPQIVEDIQSGKVQLECEFRDGWRDVPADKVIDLDDNGRYYFTNGSAGNCNTY